MMQSWALTSQAAPACQSSRKGEDHRAKPRLQCRICLNHTMSVCAAAVPDEAELNAPYVPPVGPEMAVPGLRLYTRGENLAEQVSGSSTQVYHLLTTTLL